ncbi:hypothetical protein [Acinetobacter radioresistens]|uniref:hypothetical protein n=1 Tax=Acinetobacter radioresistens TaxID=40216 RepID=UPI002004DF23|nr:hypothetical protein [Acinetobacter radioresistens]MCK4082064.1 hypothetical protein [Acinetobacter radioresistens]
MNLHFNEPAIVAIITALTTAILNLIVQYFLWGRKQKIEKKAITTAFVAEVEVLLEVVRERKYLEGLKEQISVMHAKSTVPYVVPIQDNYSQIYRNNLDKLYMFEPKIVKNLVLFHSLLDSLIQDVKPGGILATGGSKENFQEAATILSLAIQNGEEIKLYYNSQRTNL